MDPGEEEAGEPACLLHRVCEACGALLEDPHEPCWRCGARLTDPGVVRVGGERDSRAGAGRGSP